jgi:hypothetical protein
MIIFQRPTYLIALEISHLQDETKFLFNYDDENKSNFRVRVRDHIRSEQEMDPSPQ